LADEGASPPATRAHCRSLNRIIDLSFLPLNENDPAKAEAKALTALTRQARKWGLEPGVWVRLVRAAYDRDKTVYLTDLDGEDAPLILARAHLPKMENVLKRCDFKEVLGRCLLPSLDGLPKNAAEFWDRLFIDFYRRLADLKEAALGLSWHLARRSGFKTRFEYGGGLGASSEPPADKSSEILTEYVLQTWPSIRSRRKNGFEAKVAARVAADICAASSIFGIPWSFMSVVAQREREMGAPWPTTLEIYGRAKNLSEWIALSSHKWSEKLPALCDLDLLARSWSEDVLFNLTRKKLDLSNFCHKRYNSSESLFA
jgi:hypothetical protein